MENFLTLLKNVGVGRIVALVVAVGLMFGLLLLMVARMNTPSMALLYGGLDAKEASQITQMLAAESIPYEVRGESSVYVPQNRVGELRLKAAGEGLVGGSTAGYEIFDKTSTFGTTSMVQDINAKRALEGELARTIMSLPAVNSARVHLVVAKKRPFMNSTVESSASVALNLGSRVLNDEQINSIAQLVAAAVPDLKAGNVTIIDQRGALLSKPQGDGSQNAAVSEQAKVRRAVESQYERSIMQLLERIAGAGKASVSVHANIDFNRVEENVEIFNPDQQIARSEQRVEKTDTAQNASNNPAVGVSGNVPGQGVSGNSVGSSENSSTVEETINYEIGRTVRHQIKEPGGVENLSVAVLLEGQYRANENGGQEYIPYTPEQLEKFATLVKSAIGYNEARGDNVEVLDMPFETVEEVDVAMPFMSKDEIFRLVEYALMVLGMLIVFFTMIRPTMKALLKESGKAASAIAYDPLPGAAGGSLPAGGMAMAAPGTRQPAAPMAQSDEDSGVNIEQVSGRVKESSLKKIQEIVENYPEESVNVVRSWMAPNVGKKRGGGNDD